MVGECLLQICFDRFVQLVGSDNGFVALVLVFRAHDRERESFS